MAKTYAQLTQEIEALKTRAEAALQQEKAGVAARIRKAIAIYGMTAVELGFAGSTKGVAGQSVSNKTSASAAGKSIRAVKYRDDAGNAWGGRGPKPKWLKLGLAAGRSLESYAATGAQRPGAPTAADGAATPRPKAGRKQSKKKPKFKSGVKYRDEAGNQWSGRGPKPRWVTAAISNGKTLEQLAV